MKDELFGYLGIDTKYERKLIYYRPLIKALRGIAGDPTISASEKNAKQLRIEEFTIIKAISAYRSLIERIEGILEDIKAREEPNIFEVVTILYNEGRFEELLTIDRVRDKVDSRSYIDFHYMCRLMLSSLNGRLAEILNKYGSQFTDNIDDVSIEEAEQMSIEELNVLYQSLTRLDHTVNEIVNSHDHDHGEEYDVDGMPITSSSHSETYNQLLSHVNELILEKNRFHQTIADLSMIHQNRCAMINEMCDIIDVMVNHLFNLYDEGIEEAIHLLHENEGSAVMLVASSANFDNVKAKQIQQKTKLFEYQTKIEGFAFDKQFFYQQLEQTYNEPAIALATNLLYSESEAVQRINKIVIDSVEENKHSYNKTLKDMLNYYKQEAEAFKNALDLAIDKEEIRLFYYIGDTLRNVQTVNVEWIETFFEKMKTY